MSDFEVSPIGGGAAIADLRKRLSDVEAERDALAAQLDRPRIKIIGDLINAGLSPEEIPASLARQKLLWQADAMEWAAERAGPGGAPWLNALAEDYRRQAEEK